VMGIRGHTFSAWMFLASTPGLYVGAAQTPSLSAQDIAGTTSRTSKVWHVGDSPALLEGSHRSIRLRPLHSQPTGGRVELLPVGSRATHPKQVIRPANRAVPQGGSPALEVERIQNGIPSTVLLLALVDGPVGTPDRYAVPNDRTLSISAPGFLANDIDLNGEAITAVSISDPAANGALAAFADGSFSYTPDAGF